MTALKPGNFHLILAIRIITASYSLSKYTREDQDTRELLNAYDGYAKPMYSMDKWMDVQLFGMKSTTFIALQPAANFIAADVLD
jgi:hypothetical protein